MQKYEKGANRVSAASLYRMARVMAVPMAFFFETLDGTIDPTVPEEGFPNPTADQPEAVDLGAVIAGLPPQLRIAVIQFVTACGVRRNGGVSS